MRDFFVAGGKMQIESTADTSYGFRPELFAVAAGSYVSNRSFGAGAAEVGSYSASQLPSGSFVVGPTTYNVSTTALMRRADNNVDINVNITLNRAITPPDTETGELRIKVLPRTSSEPVRYARTFPEPARNLFLPQFFDVEILRVGVGGNWEPALPNAANHVLAARLLDDSTLALTDINQTVAPPTTAGLNVSGLDALLGGVNTGPLVISVRGSYRGITF